MGVSRRQFIHLGALAAVSAALPRESAAQVFKVSPPASSTVMSKETFLPLVGSGFKVETKSGPVWMTLLGIEDFKLAPVNPASMDVPQPAWHTAQAMPQPTAFGLQFLGNLPMPLSQGTYVFEHAQLAPTPLFIVPAGRGGQTYTAVISQLPPMHTGSAPPAGPPKRRLESPVKPPARRGVIQKLGSASTEEAD